MVCCIILKTKRRYFRFGCVVSTSHTVVYNNEGQIDGAGEEFIAFDVPSGSD